MCPPTTLVPSESKRPWDVPPGSHIRVSGMSHAFRESVKRAAHTQEFLGSAQNKPRLWAYFWDAATTRIFFWSATWPRETYGRNSPMGDWDCWRIQTPQHAPFLVEDVYAPLRDFEDNPPWGLSVDEASTVTAQASLDRYNGSHEEQARHVYEIILQIPIALAKVADQRPVTQTIAC